MSQITEVLLEQLETVSGGYPGQGIVNNVKDKLGKGAAAVDNVVSKIPGGKFVSKKIPFAGTAYGVYSAGSEWLSRPNESTFDRTRHAVGAFLW